MPSPFPGMDPFLEHPRFWPDVHHGLISEIQASLNQQLAPRYVASIEERVYVSDDGDPGRAVLVPDLSIAQHGKGPRPTAEPSAVAEPVVLTTMWEEEIHEAFVEVLDARQRQVVTTIEVLSPSNKVAGSRGRESYRSKRQRVLASRCHWMEIDLLRAGEPFLPREMLPHGDYFVHVSRVAQRPRGSVWPILLEQQLPVVEVPVRDGDPDAELDLRALLNAVYERSAYRLKIDYRLRPEPPLTDEQSRWMERLLLEKQLR